MKPSSCLESKRTALTVLGCGILILALISSAPAAEAGPAIIPTPKFVQLAGGQVRIDASNKILAGAEQLGPLAKILAGDIEKVHGLKLAAGGAKDGAKGDIVLRLVKNDPKVRGLDAYRVVVGDKVVVEGDNYDAVAMGMMTVLQALRKDAGGLTIPRMTVLDNADRMFRALQVDIRSGYHPPEWVKRAIDLARFYKVRLLELHTTESMWVGAVMDSSNGAPPQFLRQHLAWPKKDMEDVIAYAKERGVFMIPHNEMRPNDPFWPAALTVVFNPKDKFAGYVDEVDGKGKFQWKQGMDLSKDARFWDFLKAVTQRSYDQFAKGWPNGVLPYYHMGPVYGEGGASAQEAVKVLGFLMEKNPNIRLMYWNGPNENDPVLSPHKKNIAVTFYSDHWGGTPEGLLQAGYELVNVSWTPLYILPGSRQKAQRQGKWIFDEFQLYRFGAEGAFGEPVKARDGSKWKDGVIGSMLPTWEFAGPQAGEGHLENIAPCIPFYAEHAWNVLPYPYAPGAWEKARAAYQQLEPLATQIIREPRPSSPPAAVTATKGVYEDSVEVLWAAGDNHPQSVQVFRAEVNDPAQARPVSEPIPVAAVAGLTSFRDKTVKPGVHSFYWVKDSNPFGVSGPSQSAEGYTGKGVELPKAYEPFDYPAASGLDKLSGGQGWKTPWEVKESNGAIAINEKGLEYPRLKTAGRSLHLQPTDADETNRRRLPHIAIQRTLDRQDGIDGTQVWTSFLVRAQKVGVGDLFVNIGGPGIGKAWGDGLGVYTDRGGQMAAGKTYLVVARYVFHKGNDLIQMWINPEPGKQPSEADAAVTSRNYDAPASEKFSITMQPYGLGSYDLDEIRVGGTYDDVAPAVK